MRVFLLLLVLAAAAAAKEHDGDKAALLAIKAAFGNPSNFASWTPDSDCCATWYDVDCDPHTGRVVGLTVFQKDNLTGAIPDAIAGLTHLQGLVLRHLPGLSGRIPPALAKLSALEQLTISYTAVSGPVPAFLGALTNLAFLDLSFNSLTGTIPASLVDLPRLAGIDLSHNRLAGTIPPLLLSKVDPELEEQVELWLSHNHLTGIIPAGFGALNFALVDLSSNALTGDASMLFGRGKEVEYMDLSRNALSFDMSAVEFPEQLGYMDVSHNGIYGGIPAQVVNLNLTGMQVFDVSYNRLCGEVPGGGAMARFGVRSFQHNHCLCGAPLPPCNSNTLY